MMKSSLLVLATLCLHLFPAQTFSAECSDNKYTSGEHKQLGDNGFLKACIGGHLADNCTEFRVLREDGNFTYSYGDLVVLGDYFPNPERAYKNDVNVNLAELLFRCISKQGRILYEQKVHPEVKYPGCTWQVALTTPKFLKLASTNEEHFAWSNIVTYTKYHEAAINIALQAHANHDPELFNKALFYNGVADHYLTDSFAAGHIRVPRKQISKWTKKNIFSLLQHFVSDSFAMILHDSDGKDRHGNEIGLEVRNANGDHWVTHSDKELNTCRPDSDISIRLPVTAVEHSVQEVFAAYKTGQSPAATFSSLQYVPIPVEPIGLEHLHFGDNPAEDKKIIKKLEHGLPLPMRWITTRAALAKVIRALPELKTQFHLDNQTEVDNNSLLPIRVPAEYLEAYTN